MFCDRKPVFNLGDAGKCLVEKVERGEICDECKTSLGSGDEVVLFECGHVMHVACCKTSRCKQRHSLDKRFSITMLVRPNLPKRGRMTFAQANAAIANLQTRTPPPSLLQRMRLPVLKQADRARFIGESSNMASAQPRQSTQPQPSIMSPFQCLTCNETVRADRAIYRHSCGAVFDFKCVKAMGTYCASCGLPLGVGLDRIDR